MASGSDEIRGRWAKLPLSTFYGRAAELFCSSFFSGLTVLVLTILLGQMWGGLDDVFIAVILVALVVPPVLIGISCVLLVLGQIRWTTRRMVAGVLAPVGLLILSGAGVPFALAVGWLLGLIVTVDIALRDHVVLRHVINVFVTGLLVMLLGAPFPRDLTYIPVLAIALWPFSLTWDQLRDAGPRRLRIPRIDGDRIDWVALFVGLPVAVGVLMLGLDGEAAVGLLLVLAVGTAWLALRDAVLERSQEPARPRETRVEAVRRPEVHRSCCERCGGRMRTVGWAPSGCPACGGRLGPAGLWSKQPLTTRAGRRSELCYSALFSLLTLILWTVVAWLGITTNDAVVVLTLPMFLWPFFAAWRHWRDVAHAAVR